MELFKLSDWHLILCFLLICLFKFYVQSFVSPISKFSLRYSNGNNCHYKCLLFRVISESCQIKKIKKKNFQMGHFSELLVVSNSDSLCWWWILDCHPNFIPPLDARMLIFKDMEWICKDFKCLYQLILVPVSFVWVSFSWFIVLLTYEPFLYFVSWLVNRNKCQTLCILPCWVLFLFLISLFSSFILRLD